MKSFTFLILTINFLIITCYSVAGQQQWPMAGCNKERTSWASDENELYPPFNHIISFLPDYNFPFESLTILNNIICAGCAGLEVDPNMFYGIDMTTKDTIWSFPVPESGGSVSFHAPQNDTLAFVGGQGGKGLYCLDRYTGEAKWFRSMDGLYARNAIIDENRLYVISDSLYCLNIANGDTIWTHPIFGETTPAIDDLNCYVSGSKATRTFNKLTGEMIWKCYNSNHYFGFNVVDESNLYTSSNDSVLARNKENGEIVWAYVIPDASFSELETGNTAIDNNILAISVWGNADTLGQIYVLDKNTGNYKWHHTFGKEGAFTPAIANNVIYVVCWKEHKLYGFDTNTGELLFEDNSHYYKAVQPVIYNHRLYVVASGSVIELGNEIQTGNKTPAERDKQFFLNVYPNPNAGKLIIDFTVNEVSLVSLSIFDMSGKKINLLEDQLTEPGYHKINFESEQLNPGVYFCVARIAKYNLSGQELKQQVKFVVIR